MVLKPEKQASSSEACKKVEEICTFCQRPPLGKRPKEADLIIEQLILGRRTGQQRISHLQRLPTIVLILLVLSEMQCFRFKPTKFSPNSMRNGKLLFDILEQPDMESICRFSSSEHDKLAIPESVIAQFETSRSWRMEQLLAMADRLKSVTFLHPSRFRTFRVSPWILAMP